MMIRNFAPGFHEAGKIKIGIAGEARQSKSGGTYNLPQKLDHFVITTCEKDGANFKPDPIASKLGENPREIAIRLIFDGIEDNFDNSYSYYAGHKCLCRGNGQEATRRKYTKAGNVITLTGEEEKVACPCELLDPSEDGRGRCKPYGILMCVLEKAERVGGVYKFRTTSYNTIRGILTALAFIRQASGGILAGLPLWLTVSPKQVQTPKGQKTVVFIVNIEYRGSLDSLIAKGAEIAKVRSQSQIAMTEIRKSLRLLTMKDSPENEAEVVAEFHPEAQETKVIDATPTSVTTEMQEQEPEPPTVITPSKPTQQSDPRQVVRDPVSGDLVDQETGEIVEEPGAAARKDAGAAGQDAPVSPPPPAPPSPRTKASGTAPAPQTKAKPAGKKSGLSF